MDIWKCKEYEKTYKNYEIRKGLRLRFDNAVDSEVRRACKEFCKWLRTQYDFPMRIVVYIKKWERIKAMDGEMVCGTFFGPYNLLDEPYIKIAVGDYKELLKKHGKDNTLATYISVIAHELTHYFQWLNQEDLEDIDKEKQAEKYSNIILDKYAETRDHP